MRIRTRTLKGRLAMVAGLALMALPVGVEACSVCFGKTDSPLGKGLHWGVIVLLGFIFAMLAAFGAFAVYLARRSVAVESEATAESAGDNSQT